MRNLTLIAMVFTLMIFTSCKNKKPQVVYPETKKVEVSDDYHGTLIADPYRWLEYDTAQDVESWVTEQNKVTFGYLEQIPFRSKIKERLEKIWDYPKYGVPFREGGKIFFFKNSGMQNQSVLFVQNSLDGEPKELLDPNKLSEDGTVSLSGLSVSKDGKYLAFGISKAGSDWSEFKVLEVESGKETGDHLLWIKFSGISWKGEGFYYSRYDEPKKGAELSAKNEFHKVYYHKLGDAQSNDQLVYENKNQPLRNYGVQLTEDERFLVLYETETTSGNALYIKDLVKNDKTFTPIVTNFDQDYSVIDNIDDKLLILTNAHAPKYQLVLVDPTKPESKDWKTILPEKDEVLGGVSLAGGKLVAEYVKDAYSKAYVHDIEGKLLHEVALPGIGTLAGFSGKKEDDLAFFGYTSFTFPTTIFKYDVAKNESSVYRKPEIDFNGDEYETKQLFYASKDGTKVPMFIVHKKGIKLNGKNPTLLYGYGGFNASLTPNFSLSRLILLENGGVYAMANIRGGGEYGEEWHKAGTKERKQNVFDDFIAAAEFLVSEGYTSPEKLAISGGSNGGLLVGACMTQRPDLFKVALPAVGVMDMLRFHKFTIGWAWVSDYGSSENKQDFEYLIKYSPLHNIKPGTCYPATLVTTADHDDRVVPAHSFKFISALQEAQAKEKCDNPVLIRIETKAGHGGGKPTSKIIEEAADMYSFIFFNMDVKPKY